MDKILLAKMDFYGYHGVFPEENRLGQRFYVDLTLETDLQKASQTDDVKNTIDYGAVYEEVKVIMEGKPYQLIEAVAAAIIDRLFVVFKTLETCTVKITKPNPPISGHYHSVAVEMTRERHGN